MTRWIVAQAKAFGLPSLILVTVVMAHLSYDFLGSFYADQAKAARAWAYVLGGVEEVILYSAVWALCPWNPARVRVATSSVCLWGVIEGGQKAACRLALGIDTLPRPGSYHGLCDSATKLPVYMLTLLIVLLIFALQYTKNTKA